MRIKYSLSLISIFGILTLFCSSTAESISAEDEADLSEDSSIVWGPDEEGFNESELDDLLESNDPRNVTFYLYPNPENSADNDVIILDDQDSLKKSRYNISKTPLIIIHGFSNNYTTKYSRTMKNELLKQGFADIHNIIVVDWGKLATPANLTFWLSQIKDPLKDLWYHASVKNVPVVGRVVSQFISFLVREKYVESPENVTLLGFSLGAQISGYAGAFVKQNLTAIGRITGFDPAGPLFQHVGPEKRLDPTDATFVDVVHSNQGQDGYYGTAGTADFHPNGGGPNQPDCVQSDPVGVVYNTITGSCAHNRAWIYYLKALTTNYTACRCYSQADIFCRLFCTSSARFGYFCPVTATGSYYFDIFTNEKE